MYQCNRHSVLKTIKICSIKQSRGVYYFNCAYRGDVEMPQSIWLSGLRHSSLDDARVFLTRPPASNATFMFRQRYCSAQKRVLRMTRIPTLFASNWLVRRQPRQLDAGALRINNLSLSWRRAIPCSSIKPFVDAGNCVNSGSGRRRNHCNFDWHRSHSQFDRDIFLRAYGNLHLNRFPFLSFKTLILSEKLLLK